MSPSEVQHHLQQSALASAAQAVSKGTSRSLATNGCTSPSLSMSQHTLQLTCIMVSDDPRKYFSKFSRKGYIVNLVTVKLMSNTADQKAKQRRICSHSWYTKKVRINLVFEEVIRSLSMRSPSSSTGVAVCTKSLTECLEYLGHSLVVGLQTGENE